jgi:hypothetical protein
MQACQHIHARCAFLSGFLLSANKRRVVRGGWAKGACSVTPFFTVNGGSFVQQHASCLKTRIYL